MDTLDHAENPIRRQRVELAYTLLPAAALPFVTGVLLTTQPMLVLMFILFFWLAIPAIAFGLVALGVLLCFRGFGAAIDESLDRRTRITLALTPTLFVVATFASSPWLFDTGRLTGNLARLIANRGAYEDIIAHVRAGRHDPRQKLHGKIYYVEPAPLRIAFDPDGIGDNWTGVIFDPSGALRQAKYPVPRTSPLAELFGGDLVACRPLWSDYYACSFT